MVEILAVREAGTTSKTTTTVAMRADLEVDSIRVAWAWVVEVEDLVQADFRAVVVRLRVIGR